MIDKWKKKRSKNKEEKVESEKPKLMTERGLVKNLKEQEELIKKLKKELSKSEKLAQEKMKLSKDYLNHLKRLQADFENYKKRQEKKQKEFIEFANEKLINNFLSVIDNLERALDSTKKEKNVEAIRQGVNNILKDFYNILSKEGVRPIKSIGSKFDPYKHEAVMRIETDKYAEDTVTEEFRKGYYIKSKVLRPSMVKVAVPVKKKEKKK